MTTLRCRGVLFDLDGVLVDSRAVVERTWRRWMQRHDLHVPGLIERAHGRRTVDTLREVAPQLDAEAELQWLATSELSDTENLHPILGALTAFTAVPEDRRAVVTSGDHELARLRLRHVGFPLPAVLVAAEDVANGKPAPDGYRLAAARLNLDAEQCVVIEDTPPGITAGRGAGARVLAVATTFPPDQLGDADVVVSSLIHLDIVVDGSALLVTARADTAPSHPQPASR